MGASGNLYSSTMSVICEVKIQGQIIDHISDTHQSSDNINPVWI